MKQAQGLVVVFYSPDFQKDHPLFQATGFHFQALNELAGLRANGGCPFGILLWDSYFQREEADLERWRLAFDGQLRIIATDHTPRADFLVPRDWSPAFTFKALEASVREFDLIDAQRSLNEELVHEHQKLFQLTKIGLALSAETDLARLLTIILTEGRHFAACDAASLFLVDREDPDAPHLVFKLTQNDSITFPFNEQKFPLSIHSISGFVASTGQILNIDDVYQIPSDAPYHFNRSFDESMNYRSRSMVTIPMRNHHQKVIGVLQFINRKTSRELVLSSPEVTLAETLPFPHDLAKLLEALASQAAVAIEKSVLLARINHLFEGFVAAAVTAIEQRDPTTSGHSFRVAGLTTALAVATPKSGMNRFQQLSFSESQLKEIRYASLLHDFGKVGVREPVLLKAKKLPEGGLETIWSRFAVFKLLSKNSALQKKLDYLLQHGRLAYQEVAEAFQRESELHINEIEAMYQEIAAANEPSILPEGRFSHLERYRNMDPLVLEGRTLRWLSNDEFLALSVRKGSLTNEERKEIESHVVHTYRFLMRIPWTPELSQIPAFAVAHHEKLNGTGYPNGLQDPEIPLPAKMMAVSDIYDALTASDRPYKKSLPIEKALSILESEAESRLLDRDLVQIFIDAKIYQTKIQLLDEHKDCPDHNSHKRSVCDYDLPQFKG